MELLKLNLLEHPARPIKSNPEEFEYHTLSMFVDMVEEDNTRFFIVESKKGVYDSRRKTNRILLDKKVVQTLQAVTSSFLDQLEQGELVPCKKCYDYVEVDNDYCASCDRKRLKIWKRFGKEGVVQFGYKPIEETEIE